MSMATLKPRLNAAFGWLFVLLNIMGIFWAISLEEKHVREPLLILLLIFPAFFISIMFHELGHLIAGILGGFRFQSFSLGPITILASRNHWRILLNHNPVLGLVKFAIEDTRNLRRHLQTYYLGGAAAGVISSLIFLGILFSLIDIDGNPETSVTSIAEPWLSIVIIFSFWVMLGSFVFGSIVPMIPIKVRGIPSDGMQLDNLRAMSTQEFERFAAIVVLTYTRRRPRDWNPDLLEKLTADNSTPATQMTNSMFLYFRYLDRVNIPEADRYEVELLKAARQLDEATLRIVLLEAAYFEVRWRGNLSVAQNYIHQAGTEALKNSTNRALAAVLFAEGELVKANRCVDNALKRLECAPFTGLVEFEIDQLLELRAVHTPAN